MTEQEFLLTSVLGCRRVDLYTKPVCLTPVQEFEYRSLAQRLYQGEPVQYVVGECEFMGLNFGVDESVLIPRPETELVVEEIIAKVENLSKRALRILDLGTGSGNIAVSLAKFFPASIVKTVDISAAALKVAYANACAHEVQQQVEFIHADMRDFLRDEKGKFDLIVSNPPYIPRKQLSRLPRNVQHEPIAALDGGEDGLNFYRLIVGQAARLLEPNGYLFFEIGDGQKVALEGILDQSGDLEEVNFKKDYRYLDRVLSAKNKGEPHG